MYQTVPNLLMKSKIFTTYIRVELVLTVEELDQATIKTTL